MNKTRKTFLVFLLIALQSAIAITAGVAALCFLSGNIVPAGAFAGDVSIGGMEYPDAAKAVDQYYAGQFKQKSVLIETEGGKFEIPFSRLNARVDGDATVRSFQSMDSFDNISNLINAFFGQAKPVLQPVIRINEGELREALVELGDKLYKAPVDAELNYKGGIIEKKAEADGVAINIENAASLIEKQIAADPWKPVQFKRSGNYELQAVPAERKLKDYDDIQQVLSEYSTDILDKELIDGIELAVDAINGLVIPASGAGLDTETFSFVEWLKMTDAEFEYDNEGYDQVASTLYAALLKAGLPVDSITRLQHKLAPDYIAPGLDAWISASAGDLKFKNPFSHQMAIFAQVDHGRVKVIIAGFPGDKKEAFDIRTETVQTIKPPVYNVENERLKAGERIVLNPGKEGVVVNVYRNGKLLGTDQYEAERAIVQIGPGTEWTEDGK